MILRPTEPLASRGRAVDGPPSWSSGAAVRPAAPGTPNRAANLEPDEPTSAVVGHLIAAACSIPGFFLLLFAFAALPTYFVYGWIVVMWVEQRQPGLIGPFIMFAVGTVLSNIALVIAAIQACVRPTASVPAILLDAAEEPELMATIAEVAQRAGARMPQHVLLHADATCFVTTQRLIALNGRTRGPALVLGLPCLIGLSTAELRALLRHELTHFTGWDLWILRIFSPAMRGLAKYLNAMDQLAAGRGVMMGILKLPMRSAAAGLRVYVGWMRWHAHALSRDGERRADAEAAGTYGPQLVGSALTSLALVAHAYAAIAAHRAGPPVLDDLLFDADAEVGVVGAVPPTTPTETGSTAAGSSASAHPTRYAALQAAAMAGLWNDEALTAIAEADAEARATTHDTLSRRLARLAALPPGTGAAVSEAPAPVGSTAVSACTLLARAPAYATFLETRVRVVPYIPPELEARLAAARVERDRRERVESQNATLWRRLGAGIVDYSIAFAPVIWLPDLVRTGNTAIDDVTFIFLGIGAPLVYLTLFDATSFRGTPGKRFFGLALITRKGLGASFEAVALRALSLGMLAGPLQMFGLISLVLPLIIPYSVLDLISLTRLIELPAAQRVRTRSPCRAPRP